MEEKLLLDYSSLPPEMINISREYVGIDLRVFAMDLLDYVLEENYEELNNEELNFIEQKYQSEILIQDIVQILNEITNITMAIFEKYVNTGEFIFPDRYFDGKFIFEPDSVIHIFHNEEEIIERLHLEFEDDYEEIIDKMNIENFDSVSIETISNFMEFIYRSLFRMIVEEK